MLLLLTILFGACAPAPSEGTTEPTTRRIAFLRSVASPGSLTDRALLDELARQDFVEGRNLTVIGGGEDEVFADLDQARSVVAQWRDQGVDIIVAYSTAGAEIARDYAGEANVLFMVNDPVASGLVRDPQRPEGRMTGVTFRVPADRMLALARRIMPDLRRVGLPYPLDDPAAIPNRDHFVEAAEDVGLQLITEQFSDADDLSRAVAVLVERHGVELLLASVTPTATRAIPQLAEAASAHQVPFAANVGTVEQAILTLSPDGETLGNQLGRQAARLLRGDPVSSVPVEDPRRFHFALSELVATELGIALPRDVLREADLVRR